MRCTPCSSAALIRSSHSGHARGQRLLDEHVAIRLNCGVCDRRVRARGVATTTTSALSSTRSRLSSSLTSGTCGRLPRGAAGRGPRRSPDVGHAENTAARASSPSCRIPRPRPRAPASTRWSGRSCGSPQPESVRAVSPVGGRPVEVAAFIPEPLPVVTLPGVMTVACRPHRPTPILLKSSRSPRAQDYRVGYGT